MKIKHLLCFIALCLFFTPGKAQQLSVMTLRNGATVYIWEDKSKPDVFGMIAFKVGSVDDPEQYTGLAHYLEHVMFKGTQTIDALDWEKEKPIYENIIAKYDERAALSDPAAREAVDKEINDLTREAAQYAAGNEFSLLVDHMGGQGLNASTGYDQTEYHNSFPPSQLEKWLEIYSERLIDPVFRGFQTELEAVYEEYNMYNDDRGSRMREFIYEQAFGDHPYARPIIGLPEHLKNPQLSKLIDFYNTWYGPQNMSIILVGNIDAKEAIPMIRDKFERVPPPSRDTSGKETRPPIQRSHGKERENFLLSYAGPHLQWSSFERQRRNRIGNLLPTSLQFTKNRYPRQTATRRRHHERRRISKCHARCWDSHDQCHSLFRCEPKSLGQSQIGRKNRIILFAPTAKRGVRRSDPRSYQTKPDTRIRPANGIERNEGLYLSLSFQYGSRSVGHRQLQRKSQSRHHRRGESRSKEIL